LNETIEILLQHCSIRSFTDDRLTQEQIHTIVDAAQMASTTSYMQAYTIMGITDESKKASKLIIKTEATTHVRIRGQT